MNYRCLGRHAIWNFFLIFFIEIGFAIFAFYFMGESGTPSKYVKILHPPFWYYIGILAVISNFCLQIYFATASIFAMTLGNDPSSSDNRVDIGHYGVVTNIVLMFLVDPLLKVITYISMTFLYDEGYPVEWEKYQRPHNETFNSEDWYIRRVTYPNKTRDMLVMGIRVFLVAKMIYYLICLTTLFSSELIPRVKNFCCPSEDDSQNNNIDMEEIGRYRN